MIVIGLLMTLMGTAGCEKEPKEAAPIESGDTFTYAFVVSAGPSSSQYSATVTLTVEGPNAVRLDSDPPLGQAPVVANKALSARRLIPMHSLGMLWLPTEARTLGAKTDAGTVQSERAFRNHTTFVIPQPGQLTNERYYDKATGFLVGYQVNAPSGPTTCTLLESSIQGL
ncbi:MAG: hypothetical protein H6729_06370 [Deltaproteobacteria bacterium]|nr:hypothetical protein [Deltaproteobacteria bacterium]